VEAKCRNLSRRLARRRWAAIRSGAILRVRRRRNRRLDDELLGARNPRPAGTGRRMLLGSASQGLRMRVDLQAMLPRTEIN